MIQITEENYDKILYCPECGSSNVSIQLWYDQETNKTEDPLAASYDNRGYCNDCDSDIHLLTLSELWIRWKKFQAKHTKVDGTCVVIMQEFLGFSEGTPVADIMHWFDDRCPHSIYKDLELVSLR